MHQTKFRKYFVLQSNNSEKIYNYRVLDVLSGGALTKTLSDMSSERLKLKTGLSKIISEANASARERHANLLNEF